MNTILDYQSGALLGEVVLTAQLLPNLQLQTVTPQSFDFGGSLTSGWQTYGGVWNPVAVFDFSTDATGTITAWDMHLHSDTGGGFSASQDAVSALTGDAYTLYSSRGNCDIDPSLCTNIVDVSPQGAWTVKAPEIGTDSAAFAMLTLLVAVIAVMRGAT